MFNFLNEKEGKIALIVISQYFKIMHRKKFCFQNLYILLFYKQKLWIIFFVGDIFINRECRVADFPVLLVSNRRMGTYKKTLVACFLMDYNMSQDESNWQGTPGVGLPCKSNMIVTFFCGYFPLFHSTSRRTVRNTVWGPFFTSSLQTSLGPLGSFHLKNRIIRDSTKLWAYVSEKLAIGVRVQRNLHLIALFRGHCWWILW